MVSHGSDSIFRGKVFANSGYFRGQISIAGREILLNTDGSGQLADGSIAWDAEGNPVVAGKFTTSLNGRRIEINPTDNSLVMYDESNRKVININYTLDNGMTRPEIEMTNYSSDGTVWGASHIGPSGISSTMGTNTIIVGAFSHIQITDTSDNTFAMLSSRGLSFQKDGQLVKSYP